jgi:hypothetical protein
MAKIVRKSVVFNIDEDLWKEFNEYVKYLKSYNGRILVKMIEYVLRHREDFEKFLGKRSEEKEKKEEAKVTIEYITA